MISEATLKEQLKHSERLLFAQEASDDLLKFMRLSMPDPEDVDDATRSQFNETPLARLLCQIMAKVYSGEYKRVAVSVGPQLGKSQILSRGAPAWFAGKDPTKNIILGTYNQDFANEFGDAVRDIMSSQAYQQVFPRTALRKGGAAKDLLITTAGGRMAFVGRGGSGTGKPADLFLVDDPLKDDIEAQSDTLRDQVWNWFTKVALTRVHVNSSIVIVHTRWHQDDLIGRLCDPEHPERNKKYAGLGDEWVYINLPAVVKDKRLADALGLKLEKPTDPLVIEMLGSEPMVALVPERKPLRFLASAKRYDPAGFNALYMGKPTPDDGDYFKSDWLVEYDRNELPQNLRVYGASDHAVSTKQGGDYTVLGCVGVDESDDIWVLPSLVWDRMATDRTVDEMIGLMRQHKPYYWWMENELISKSFGPFLRKRMQEEKTYVPLDGVTPSKDKMTRAQAIRGRMAMRKVRFPRFMPWWNDAKMQMLRFPNGANDDFVDWISWIGQGLIKEVRASPTEDEKVVSVGSINWVLKKSQERARKEDRLKRTAGW